MVVSQEVRVDTFVRDGTMYRDPISLFQHLSTPLWERFMESRVKKIFEQGGTIIDIGGGLRIDETRSDREDPTRVKKYKKFLSDPSINYKITDYTNTYKPDYIEDIHALSFEDNSIEGLFCIAALEHVYDPLKATAEIVRVLKPGGMAFVYAPFVYRYHAHQHDYRDYYRFTKDGWGYLFRQCSTLEFCPVRGLFESLLRFTPLHTFSPFTLGARILDYSSPKMRSISEVQTSGYNVFFIK